MIKADAHYVIGQSHLYAQDYALASTTDLVPYSLVADGCSSAAHADIGARLIALAAKHYVLNHIANMPEVPRVKTLALAVAHHAAAAASLLGLPADSFDATLNLAFVKNNQLHIYLLGDGVIAVDTVTCGLEYLSVQYSHNAPFYPAYLTDESRLDRYRSFSVNDRVIVSGPLADAVTLAAIDDYVYLTFPIDEVRAVFVASDGMESFVDAVEPRILSLAEVLPELTRFQNTADSFLKRRMKRALKNWARNNIANSDDLSIAALVRVPDQREGGP